MQALEDDLENLEFLLEDARCAGNQQAIYVLGKQREHVLRRIQETRTKR